MHRTNMKLPAKIKLSLPGDLRVPQLHIPKPALVATGTACLVLLSLAALVPGMLDGSRQGQAIAAQLADATGHLVRIEGGVEVSLFPSPHIALNQFRLISRDGATTLLSAPRVDLSVSYGSLFSGNYNVSEVKLVRPLITLTAQQAAIRPNLYALSISRIAVENGTMDIALAGQPERISHINGTLHLPAATTLVRTDLKADWRGAPIHLALDLSPPAGTDSAIGYLKLDVGAAEAAILMVGKLDLLGANRRIDADIDVNAGQAGSLWALFSSLGVLPAAPVDAGLRQQLAFTARLTGDSKAYDLSAVNMRLGNWKAGGLARYVLGDNGGLSVALKTDVVDLALWPTVVDWMQRGELALGNEMLGAFDLQMAGVTLGSYRAAPVLLKGDINSSTIKVNEFVAMLPGDARVQFSGSLSTQTDAPAMAEGKLQLEGVRLRDTLAGLGLALPADLDDTALRQIKLAADIRGPWRTWSVPSLDVTLDGVHVTGQLARRPDSGVFDTNLNIDQFDLDRYAQAKSLPNWLWQLPSSNVSVTFKQLRAMSKTANNVVLTAVLAPNLLTIKSLDAADFGGNAIRLSGSLSPDAAQDTDLSLRLSTPDFAQLREGFAPAARLLPAIVASQLSGPVDLSVRYRRTAGEQQQLSSATIGDGRIDLVVTDRSNQGTTFKIRLQNRETATVLRQLLPGSLARQDAVLGNLDFYLEGAKQPAGNWQLSGIQGQIAGVTVRSGTLTASPTQPYSLTGNLDLANTNVDLWRQTLQPAMVLGRLMANIDINVERLTVVGEQLTDVSGQLRFSPPANIAVSNLVGKWEQGRVTMNGEGALAPVLAVKGHLDVREANVALRGGDRFGVSGVADFGVRVEGRGADWASLMRSLNGDGEFSMDSGSVSGIDFASLTESLQGRRGHNARSSNLSLEAMLERGGDSALSSFGGDFEIEDGLAKANVLRLRTPSASAEVKTTVDLSRPRLDAVATISLREITGAPPFVMALSGPVNDLSAHFDTAALSQHLQPPAATVADKPAEGTSQTAAAQRSKPDERNAATAEAEAREAASAAAAFAIMPPEEPVPPSLDGTGALMPVATAAELAALEGAAPAAGGAAQARAAAPAPASNINRQQRQRRNQQNAAANNSQATQRAAAPAQRATAAPRATAGSDAPPSIQEMLAAMPALQSDVAAAVTEARATAESASSSGGAPRIDFTAASAAAPRAGNAASASSRNAAPVRSGGLAPEFEQSPTPVRETVSSNANGARVIQTDGLTIRLPGEDEEGTGGMEPAANVGDLMNRVQGQ